MVRCTPFLMFDYFIKDFYSFDRPFYEVEGCSVKHLDDGSDMLFINALGINPEDIKIEIKSEYPNSQAVSIVGQTRNEVLDEDFSMKFCFRSNKPIKKISKTSQSGLLALKIEYDVPAQLNVEIVEDKKLLES